MSLDAYKRNAVNAVHGMHSMQQVLSSIGATGFSRLKHRFARLFLATCKVPSF